MKTVLLLVGSNLFMTYAWYGHLRTLRSAPWYVAVFASWGVALFEYALQVPANRIGYGRFSLGQLKIMEEVIALAVFVPFSIVYMKEVRQKLDCLQTAAVHRRGRVLHISLALTAPPGKPSATSNA